MKYNSNKTWIPSQRELFHFVVAIITNDTIVWSRDRYNKMNSKDYLFCYRTQNFYTWLNLTETNYFIPSNTYNMKNSKIFVCTYMDLSSYTTHLHNDGSSICGVSACTRMWVYQLMNYVLVDLRILLLLQISMSKLGIIYKSVSTQ